MLATVAAPAVAAPAKLLCWRVSETNARTWAGGILTDFALKLAEVRDGPALFIHTIEGAAAWRSLAAEIERQPPALMIFRAMSPVIEARARRYGLRPQHTDEWAHRFLMEGDAMRRFNADLSPP